MRENPNPNQLSKLNCLPNGDNEHHPFHAWNQYEPDGSPCQCGAMRKQASLLLRTIQWWDDEKQRHVSMLYDVKDQ